MTRRTGAIALVCLTLVFQSIAQDNSPVTYADKITEADLKDYLSILASDAMEGRETGKRGQKMAAAFIAAHFHDLGLKPPVGGEYYQKLKVYTTQPGETYLQTGTTKHVNFTTVAYFGTDSTMGEISLPLVFAGYGTDGDLSQVDVNGKAALILMKSQWLAGNKEVALLREKGAKMVIVCNTETKGDFDGLSNHIKGMASRNGLSLEKPDMNDYQKPGFFVVSPTVLEELIGLPLQKLKSAAASDPKKKALKKIKGSSIKYKTTIDIKVIDTENVLGFMEGTDKKDEIVLLTAHYDHVGVKTSGTGDLIHNGADDDGSGTVAVMEMAKIFTEAKRAGHGPRRSILFMLVTGEESGLLGSEYYAEHPVFPLERTVVDLNIDMVGRRDPKHKDSPPYLYVIGADKLSTELNTVSEAANNMYSKLVFDYTYNDPSHPDRLYYRSDHWNFAKRNIPIIFYFDGIHEDYHKVSDEVSKIEFDLLAKRTQCIFYTAWELVNREVRIMPDIK